MSFSEGYNLNQNSLDAEIEIYKSDNTIADAIENIKTNFSSKEDNIPSAGYVRSNLDLKTDSVSLITITYKSNNLFLNKIVLDQLNEEFIKDRANFKKQSTAAGREFIKNEIPRIKELLKEAENNLNNFKILLILLM